VDNELVIMKEKIKEKVLEELNKLMTEKKMKTLFKRFLRTKTIFLTNPNDFKGHIDDWITIEFAHWMLQRFQKTIERIK